MHTEIIYSVENELEGWANPSVMVVEPQLRAWLLENSLSLSRFLSCTNTMRLSTLLVSRNEGARSQVTGQSCLYGKLWHCFYKTDFQFQTHGLLPLQILCVPNRLPELDTVFLRMSAVIHLPDSEQTMLKLYEA